MEIGNLIKKNKIKASLRLGFMIQFKAKTPNNIPTLAFTPYVKALMS